MKKKLELYVHIPFCVRKCAYCDFLSWAATEEEVASYLECLEKEIYSYASLARNYEVDTIFIGGGTPSVLSGAQMKELFQVLRSVFVIAEDAEITVEANPGTVTEEKLVAYRKAGMNRISFGLQSADDRELRLLGRVHTYEEFLESYRLARACGFQNVNVDLISAIPGQTVEGFLETLKKVVSLHPEHISAYSLIIEEGTKFFELYGKGKEGEKELPTEEEEREIYHKTESSLKKYGYEHYEISNYAMEGKECRHNLGYWERKEYLGIGLGAASLLGHDRFKNEDSLSIYMERTKTGESVWCEKETLSETEEMEEYLFLGLRKIKGVSIKAFENIFHKSLYRCYGNNISRLEKDGLLEESQGYLRLTKKGIDVSNYVFTELLC